MDHYGPIPVAPCNLLLTSQHDLSFNHLAACRIHNLTVDLFRYSVEDPPFHFHYRIRFPLSQLAHLRFYRPSFAKLKTLNFAIESIIDSKFNNLLALDTASQEPFGS